MANNTPRKLRIDYSQIGLMIIVILALLFIISSRIFFSSQVEQFHEMDIDEDEEFASVGVILFGWFSSLAVFSIFLGFLCAFESEIIKQVGNSESAKPKSCSMCGETMLETKEIKKWFCPKCAVIYELQFTDKYKIYLYIWYILFIISLMTIILSLSMLW